MREIKLNSIVSWKHKTPEWFSGTGSKFIIAEGKIIKIFETSLGGKRNFKKAVKVLLFPHKYWKEINRNTTVISFDKLKENLIED